MKLLLAVSLVASVLAAAPPAAADNWSCADPDDPLTGSPCLHVVALLNCATHLPQGEPCSLP